MSQVKIYGDGLHDDTDGIQALLDTRARLIELPMPEETYLISRPLEIHSQQQLRLPALARIRLMDGANCLMLKNASWEEGDRDIYVSGGIWDGNNLKQPPNPQWFPHPELPDYTGISIQFQNVKNLHLQHMQLKDPVTFAITLDKVSYFTVEDITFDFNYGKPWAVNMDGIHLNGNCHYGSIRNLKGACYDDLVALNADEGTAGPITNIDIDGIFAEDCHSAVRLLSVNHKVENIHIRNVFGTYYQYCIGVTKFYKGEATAYFDGLTFDNIYASKAQRLPVYHKEGGRVYPLIWIESNLRVKNLAIASLHRVEKTIPVSTLFIAKDTVVENLSLSDISCENRTGTPFPLVENNGVIRRLYAVNLRSGGETIYSGTGEYPET